MCAVIYAIIVVTYVTIMFDIIEWSHRCDYNLDGKVK
jgi:hypothetical protein